MKNPANENEYLVTREWFITAITTSGARIDDVFSVAGDSGSVIAAKQSGGQATIVGMMFGGGAGMKRIVSDITWFTPASRLVASTAQLLSANLHPCTPEHQASHTSTPLPSSALKLVHTEPPTEAVSEDTKQRARDFRKIRLASLLDPDAPFHPPQPAKEEPDIDWSAYEGYDNIEIDSIL
ncbi:hypothetical protein K440DRAFT_256832 [Wilcoxina mikolae CBS 423.85]|nr:hypothetical protein K440DRAFT_256832 [Wilcoxina mikolae CBS 423.85]